MPATAGIADKALLGFVLAVLWVSCCEAIAPGLWAIGGADAELGRYQGMLELRLGDNGMLEAIRVVALEDLLHTDGRVIDLVWTGSVASDLADGATLTMSLARADSITQVGDLVRTAADVTPLVVMGSLRLFADQSIDVAYTAPTRPAFAVPETGVFMGLSVAEPLWQSRRTIRETHPEIPTTRKRALFTLYEPYHALLQVQPYVSDLRFQRGMHFEVVDHTDFDYYRSHPERLRVVNKVVDAISLAETEVRANAFGTRLADKAAFYQEGLTLPAGDPLRAQLPPHARALLALCLFQRQPSTECGGNDTGRETLSLNPGAAELLAGITNAAPALIASGLAWLRQPTLRMYAKAGARPFYTHGSSDWSGNHLTLVSTVAIQWLLRHTRDRALATLWQRASGEAWRVLHRLEPSLHAVLAAGMRALDNPAELAEATDQALWGLRSFPIPKHPHPVDHRLHADFVLSPFPALPWKMDWQTNSAGQQSLIAYSPLEQGSDHYRWNDSAFSISRHLGDKEVPGVDYLFLYWLARHTGLITAQD